MKFKNITKKTSTNSNDSVGFLDIYLPFFYILSPYSNNISILILLIYALYKMISKKKGLIHKEYLKFMIVASVTEIIGLIRQYYSVELWLKSSISMWIIVVVFIFLSSEIHFQSFIKIYKLISFVAIIGIFYQSVQTYVFHQTVSPITLVNVTDTTKWALNVSRPMSIFSEPQVAATYFLPLLLFVIFYGEYLWATIITVAILLTGSTQGIIMVVVIWTYVIFTTKGSILQKIFLFVILVLCAVLFNNLSVFKAAQTKLSNFGVGLSDYLRLYKAFDTYKELPLFEKICGIGLNNMSDYITNTEAYFSWMSTVVNVRRWGYISSGFGIFVELGAISAIMYYKFLISIVREKDNLLILMILITLIQMFSQAFMFNGAFIFYLLICFNYLNDKQLLSRFKNIIVK